MRKLVMVLCAHIDMSTTVQHIKSNMSAINGDVVIVVDDKSELKDIPFPKSEPFILNAMERYETYHDPNFHKKGKRRRARKY